MRGGPVGCSVLSYVVVFVQSPKQDAIVDISAISDPEGFKVITQRPTASTATVMQGALYTARTDKITALDGTVPKRFIVIAFDSLEKAQAWNDSTAQKEI